MGHIPTRPQTGPVDMDPRPLKSMVAGAARLTGGRTITRGATAKGWQDDAWGMYDEVPELRFLANTIAQASSRLRLIVAKVPDGGSDPIPVELDVDPDDEHADQPTEQDRRAVEMLDAFGGGMAGQAELIRRCVLNLYVPGDVYLIGTRPGALDPSDDPDPQDGIGPDGGELVVDDLEWHAFSVTEVKFADRVVTVARGDTGKGVDLDLDSECVVVRVWQPHPRRWWDADSPVRSSLPVLRELVGLTKHVAATIDSRLAGAGVFVVPQSAEVALPDSDNPDQPDDDRTPPSIVSALIDAMVTALEDRDNAASIAPIVLTVPDEVAEKFGQSNLIQFSTPFDAQSKDLRDEAIRRFALGADAPAEVLLGLGSANHWSAWQIDEATAKLHVEPKVALLCDALTTQYLRPALEAADVDGADQYVVWYDPAALVMRPNRTPEALDLYDRGELSGDALRTHAGFDPADAPAVGMDAATEIVVGIAKGAPNLVAANPAVLVVLLDILRALIDGEPVDVSTLPTPDNGNGTPASEDASPTPDTENDPPPAVAASANGNHRTRVPRGR